MGPAVTLEKTNIGVKRYLPLPSAMPRSGTGRTARRHSGSVSGCHLVEENLKKPRNVKNLRRQWSFDCALAVGQAGDTPDDVSGSVCDASKPKQCGLSSNTIFKATVGVDLDKRQHGLRPLVLCCKNLQCQQSTYKVASFESPSMCDSPTIWAYVPGRCGGRNVLDSSPVNRNSPSLSEARTGSCISTDDQGSSKKQEVDQKVDTPVDDGSASLSIDTNNVVEELLSTNEKLSQRATALLRKVKHLHKKNVRLNFEKYLIQIQTILKRREEVRSGRSDAANASVVIDLLRSWVRAEPSGTFDVTNCDATKRLLDDLPSKFHSVQDDPFLALSKKAANTAHHLTSLLDADATDESSSCSSSSSSSSSSSEEDEEEEMFNGAEQKDVVLSGKKCSEIDWVISKAEIMAKWYRLEQHLKHLGTEIATSRRILKKRKRVRGQKDGEWMARCNPSSTKITFVRLRTRANEDGMASRCLPFDCQQRKKLFPVQLSGDSASGMDACIRCERRDRQEESLQPSTTEEDAARRLCEAMWKRWSLSDSSSRTSDLVPIAAPGVLAASRALVRNDFCDVRYKHPPDFHQKDYRRIDVKSKSMTRFPSKRQNVKSSSSRTAAEMTTQQGRKSNSSFYDIDDVILLPTNSSSRREMSIRKKEISVPMWRYMSPRSNADDGDDDDDEVDEEDTSDEAFVRRHLEPERREKTHRLPEFAPHSRRHHKGYVRHEGSRDGPSSRGKGSRRRCVTNSSFGSDGFLDDRRSCRGDEGRGKHGPSDDWSSISRHSDDKSGDGMSWPSATEPPCAPPSNISTDSTLPGTEFPPGNRIFPKSSIVGGGDYLASGGSSNDSSCSTTSACSLLAFDFRL